MNYNEFVTGCATQGVDFYVAQETWDTQLTISSRFGRYLREGIPVSSGQIAIDGFCEGNTYYRQHAEIANSRLSPAKDHPLSFAEGGKSVGHCSDAEPRFASWLKGLATGDLVGGRILIDEANSPVAIQKSVIWGRFGEPSSLLLKDVMVDGVELPAGSIVYMRKKWNVLSRRGPVSGEATGLMRTKHVLGMSFLRLSGFALSDAEWKEFGLYTSRGEMAHIERATEVASQYVESVISNSFGARVRRLVNFSFLKGTDMVESK